MDLDGKHVVVTGASQGIGEAMAKRFAAAGSQVSVVARNQAKLEDLTDRIGSRAFPADLSEPETVDGLIARIEAEAGPIDVLVNNAGLATTEWLADLDPDEIRAVARLNLEVPMVLTNRVVPGMMDRGSGHLVFTSSLAGTAGFPGLAVYGATKAGLLNFVNALRLELRGTTVGTTVVSPGPIATEMWDQLEAETGIAPTLRRLRLLRLIPVRDPDWLANATVRAVESGDRHVRTPRRLSSNFWLGAAPTRMTELLLRGVRTGPRA